MNISDQISLVKKEVESFFEKNAEWCNVAHLNESEKAHIIQIGTSILCTKWSVGYEGGGFVQHFVNNNLMGALSSADGTTIKGFQFFGRLVYNVGKPVVLCNIEPTLN